MTEYNGKSGAVLSALVATLEPDPVQPALIAAGRSQLMAALHGPERWTPWAPAVSALLQITEPDALSALQLIEQQGVWRAGLWPGSCYLQTPPLAAALAGIARIAPGTKIARHRHEHRELTFVLDGQLLETDGRAYGCGELVDKPVGSEHEVTVADTSACLVIFALRVR
ncbi:MAG: hypothetical protein RL701_6591 [Pseudomonadota bacterium]